MALLMLVGLSASNSTAETLAPVSLPASFLAKAIFTSATANCVKAPLPASVCEAMVPTAPAPPRTVTLDISFLLSNSDSFAEGVDPLFK